MPRTCTVCRHPDRQAIDQALLNGRPLRAIAAHTGTSTGALQRHKADCLPAHLATAQAAREVLNADRLVDELGVLRVQAWLLLDRAEKAGDLRSALSSIKEVRATLELLLRLAGELATEPAVVVALHASPEWAATQATLVRALAPYPEARAAAAAALAALGTGDAP